MKLEETKRLEHICLKSDLDLESFGEEFQKALSLPKMHYDYENETEWLTIDLEKINYNISKPYLEGTLQEWDDTTPDGCNFGIVLSIHKNHALVLDEDWVDELVVNVCRQLASSFSTKVYHHRSFTFGVNISKHKNAVFNP